MYLLDEDAECLKAHSPATQIYDAWFSWFW